MIPTAIYYSKSKKVKFLSLWTKSRQNVRVNRVRTELSREFMTTILVVEDTASEQDLITSYLTEGGYTVITATNGQDALKEIENCKPDVVITDLVMPGMSGLELCRSLKKNAETKDVPIVACTSKNQELDKLWGMKQGVNVYITKPFTREDILRAVRSVA